MSTRRTIETIITTSHGIRVKATLQQGRDTNDTWTGKRGSEWHLEVGENQPTLKTYRWDADTDVDAKAAEGFEAGHVWEMYSESLLVFVEGNGLILPPALTLKEKLNAFNDATAGKRVRMTVDEVTTLCERFEAYSHAEAVNEILIELGWKERENMKFELELITSAGECHEVSTHELLNEAIAAANAAVEQSNDDGTRFRVTPVGGGKILYEVEG